MLLVLVCSQDRERKSKHTRAMEDIKKENKKLEQAWNEHLEEMGGSMVNDVVEGHSSQYHVVIVPVQRALWSSLPLCI